MKRPLPVRRIGHDVTNSMSPAAAITAPGSTRLNGLSRSRRATDTHNPTRSSTIPTHRCTKTPCEKYRYTTTPLTLPASVSYDHAGPPFHEAPAPPSSTQESTTPRGTSTIPRAVPKRDTQPYLRNAPDYGVPSRAPAPLAGGTPYPRDKPARLPPRVDAASRSPRSCACVETYRALVGLSRACERVESFRAFVRAGRTTARERRALMAFVCVG